MFFSFAVLVDLKTNSNSIHTANVQTFVSSLRKTFSHHWLLVGSFPKLLWATQTNDTMICDTNYFHRLKTESQLFEYACVALSFRSRTTTTKQHELIPESSTMGAATTSLCEGNILCAINVTFVIRKYKIYFRCLLSSQNQVMEVKSRFLQIVSSILWKHVVHKFIFGHMVQLSCCLLHRQNRTVNRRSSVRTLKIQLIDHTPRMWVIDKW